MKRIKFVGLDVHAETITVAVAGTGSKVRGGGAHIGTGEIGRSGEDRPAGCAEAGSELSSRRVDVGVGSGCGP